MNKVDLVTGDEDNLVTNIHYVSAFNDDRTLCGDQYDTHQDMYGEPKETNKRVTCKFCLTIKNHVMGAK